MLTLQDQGNGKYTGSYSVPDVPGFLGAQVNADGMDGGVVFSRQVNWLGSIAPGVLTLPGQYNGQAINENGDALFETYDLAVDVSVTQSTQATFVANLSANGTEVASAYQEATLTPGVQTIHLSFAGDDIRRSRLDGPYTVTRLSVIDTSLGIPVYLVENPLQTEAYNWQAFGGCHSLEISALPDLAGHIQANPAPNCNSGSLYSTDTQVELTAQPDYGYWFANWIVDASGSSNPVQLLVDRDKHVIANFFKITWGEPATISLSPDPANLPADGTSTSLVRAAVKDVAGNLTPGVEVSFSTNMGQLSQASATTDAAGIAATILTAPSEIGEASVKATAGSANGSTTIWFVSANQKLNFLPFVVRR
jgi:hypothetical protein